MAGAGQPWYMPLTWPVGHVSSAIARPKPVKIPAEHFFPRWLSYGIIIISFAFV